MQINNKVDKLYTHLASLLEVHTLHKSWKYFRKKHLLILLYKYTYSLKTCVSLGWGGGGVNECWSFIPFTLGDTGTCINKRFTFIFVLQFQNQNDRFKGVYPTTGDIHLAPQELSYG